MCPRRPGSCNVVHYVFMPLIRRLCRVEIVQCNATSGSWRDCGRQRLPGIRLTEESYLETHPDEDWNIIFEVYGQLERWFNMTWRLGEVELVN